MTTLRYCIPDIIANGDSQECIIEGIALDHIAQVSSNYSRVLGPCSCELPIGLVNLLNSLDLHVLLIRSISCGYIPIKALEFSGSSEDLVLLALSWLDEWGEKV